MVAASNDVALVFKYSSPTDIEGTKHRVAISNNASLADLRKLLENDGIMKRDDGFRDAEDYILTKSSEAKIKLVDAMKDSHIRILASGSNGEAKGTDELVKIPEHVKTPTSYVPVKAKTASTGVDADSLAEARAQVVGSKDFEFEDPRGLHELSNDELCLVGKYAELGLGMTIGINTAPKLTGRSVIETVDTSDMTFSACDSAHEEVVISYTAREAEYAKGGWVEASVVAETPWVSGSVEASHEASSKKSESESDLFVTGRYLLSRCTATLPYSVKAHPGFEKAVKAALDLPDPAKRTQMLSKVFGSWGHTYITSVEMGGVKFVTTRKTSVKKGDESSHEAEMKVAIGKKFGPGNAQVSVGGGINSSSSTANESSMESMKFDTCGGNEMEHDVNKWKASVGLHFNWRVISKLAAESVITLFDDETQARIIAAEPELAPAPVESAPSAPNLLAGAIPLFRMFNPGNGDHFYTVDAAERDNAIRGCGYQGEGTAAHLLPSQTDQSVPFFRMYNTGNGDHFFTTSAPERDNAVRNTFKDEGHAGFVFTTQVPGSVPLYRMYLPSRGDHFYTTDAEERDRAVNAIGYVSEGTACFVGKA